ncbi:MAG: choice-of-anchor R domain-containing protein [Phycisphaerales bacterium]
MLSFRSSLLFASATLLAGVALGATDLSSNLAAASGGSEAASGVRWLTAGFITDATNTTLTSVTLKLSGTAGSAAQIDIYTDGGIEPGTLVGTLGAIATIPATLGDVTVSGGVTLQASRSYWLVLKPLIGTINWSWTTANTGTGTGFTHAWGWADDGSTAGWWTSDFYPLQMTVTASACSNPTIDTPPASIVAPCGGSVTLTVSATAATGMTYQWRKGGSPLAEGDHIVGSTTSTLTLSSLAGSDSGQYDVVVSTVCGSATSAAALTVRSADFGGAGGLAGADGRLDNNDFIVFIDAFFAASSVADIGQQGGVFGADGAFDNNDFIAFINLFFNGCE